MLERKKFLHRIFQAILLVHEQKLRSSPSLVNDAHHWSELCLLGQGLLEQRAQEAPAFIFQGPRDPGAEALAWAVVCESTDWGLEEFRRLLGEPFPRGLAPLSLEPGPELEKLLDQQWSRDKSVYWVYAQALAEGESFRTVVLTAEEFQAGRRRWAQGYLETRMKDFLNYVPSLKKSPALVQSIVQRLQENEVSYYIYFKGTLNAHAS